MFGRKQKRIQVMSANIATLFNIQFWSLRKKNDGELPEAMQQDRYVLGYMTCATGIIAEASGLKKQKGEVMIQVFDFFFPGRGVELCRTSTELVNQKDQVFMSGFENGLDESLSYGEAVKSGDEEAIGNAAALTGLKNHINENYLYNNQ